MVAGSRQIILLRIGGIGRTILTPSPAFLLETSVSRNTVLEQERLAMFELPYRKTQGASCHGTIAQVRVMEEYSAHVLARQLWPRIRTLYIPTLGNRKRVPLTLVAEALALVMEEGIAHFHLRSIRKSHLRPPSLLSNRLPRQGY
jgi:hypothetical protein